MSNKDVCVPIGAALMLDFIRSNWYDLLGFARSLNTEVLPGSCINNQLQQEVNLVAKYPEIVVFSTFAEDSMVYLETGTVETRPGGPALWIKQTYERMGVPHKIVTSGCEVQVKLELVGGEPLPGKVFADHSTIVVSEDVLAEGILINYLDNFDISQIKLLSGTILFDIAPLTRTGEFRNKRQTVSMPELAVRERISIIKANDEEFPHLPTQWVEEQKQERIFVHTLGRRGLDLWERGTLTHFDPPKVKPRNVLGAGDTFGAAFLAEYLANGKDSIAACRLALEEVRALFANKPIEDAVEV